MPSIKVSASIVPSMNHVRDLNIRIVRKNTMKKNVASLTNAAIYYLTNNQCLCIISDMNKLDILYYARLATFDVCELVIRTVADDYFVGLDKRDKRAYLFSYSDLGKIVFENRQDALDVVLAAEERSKDECIL